MLDNLVIGVIAGLTLLGMQKWGAYGKYVWFDNVAHILGGVTVVSAPAMFLGGQISLAITFIVGLIWELFEWYKNINPWDGDDTRDKAWEDTTLDMVMVMIGAWIALQIAGYL